MEPRPAAPWQPDRRWADPLLVLLALLALLVAGTTLRLRGAAARRPATMASLQGRLAETALEASRLLGSGRVGAMKAELPLKEPWDRALLAVLEAEGGRATTPAATWIQAATPAGPGGQAFQKACLAAHAGAPLPSAADRREVHRRLGGGYAADLLEARLLDREGGGDPLRARARAALLGRLGALSLLALVGLGAAAGGLGFGIYLLSAPRQAPPPPLPSWGLSGRAAALVALVWFLGFFVAGQVAAALLLPWPSLRWAAVPLSYGLHAALGLALVSRAEDASPAELWRRVAPGRAGRDLAWGGAFLCLAVALVLVVAPLSGLILRPEQSPQRDLQELLRSAAGLGPGLVLFLTVAGLAPLFEEFLFRGFLLPVLARTGWTKVALVLTSLLFGAIHLQPAGLPVLATLGFAMGLALRHTGSLRTPLLVHACWNGSLFLLMRTFA